MSHRPFYKLPISNSPSTHATFVSPLPFSCPAIARWTATMFRYGALGWRYRLKRVCHVCGVRVVGDDFYSTAHLTSDRKSPLYEFNFIQSHVAHVAAWKDWPRFKSLALALQASD